MLRRVCEVERGGRFGTVELPFTVPERSEREGGRRENRGQRAFRSEMVLGSDESAVPPSTNSYSYTRCTRLTGTLAPARLSREQLHPR